MTRASAAAGRGRPPTYYGVPPIHKAHWTWLIVWYFFLGGVSAGSYVVAAIAELFGRREDRDAVRAGRYLAALLAVPCPILLILDLGRPERFLNMFRVLKLRSPMSLGSWGLLAYGGFAALSAAVEAARAGLLGGPLRLLAQLPSRPIAALGSGFGFFVGGYTGVLLGATAVPFWTKNARLLGPLFLSSALAGACAAVSLALSLLPGSRDRTLERLRRAEVMATIGEVAALATIHTTSGRLGAPLAEGRLGRVHRVGSLGVGLGVPLVLHLLGPRLGLPLRLVAAVSGVASLLGSLALKYAVVMAGHASADDPAATFELAGGAAADARLADLSERVEALTDPAPAPRPEGAR